MGRRFLAGLRSRSLDGAFGWQLLIFIALAAFGLASARHRRMWPLAIWPAIASGWLFAFWSFTAQQARSAIPAVLSLLPVAALGLASAWSRQEARPRGARVRRPHQHPVANDGASFGSWLAALGLISTRDYVSVSTDTHYVPLLDAIAEHTPADARLMLLFEHRGFYVPCSYVIGTPLFQEAYFTPPESFSEPERVMDVLVRAQSRTSS